jgi:hypothetical protein
MAEKCSELVARCFMARTEAHIAHLTTSSYAEHKALDEFYNGIVEVADSFAEACMGRYGMLKFQTIRPKVGDSAKPISIPSELRTWIDENRTSCGEAKELQNLIDEILHLCDSTIYKLRFLS